MLRSLPTPILAALALALVGANVLIGTPIANAEGEEEVLNVPQPSVVPINALLNHQLPDTTVDGLDVDVERTEDGHLAVVFTNPGTEAITIERHATVTQTNFRPMGRMGPIPLPVADAAVSLTVPAGQARRLTFDNVTVPAPAPEPVEGEPLHIRVLLGSTTTDVVLGDQLVGRLEA